MTYGNFYFYIFILIFIYATQERRLSPSSNTAALKPKWRMCFISSYCRPNYRSVLNKLTESRTIGFCQSSRLNVYLLKARSSVEKYSMKTMKSIIRLSRFLLRPIVLRANSLLLLFRQNESF